MLAEITRCPVGCAMLIGIILGLTAVTPLNAKAYSSNEVDVASSEDIKVTGFGLASPEDQARYWAAMDRWHHALFPNMPLPSDMMARMFPILRLSFQSKRQLFDTVEEGPRSGRFYLCEGLDRRWGLDGDTIGNTLWQDKLVDQQVSQQIADQLQTTPGPQEYEIFFEYAYWDPTAVREKEGHFKLLPIPDDICLTFEDPPFYAVSGTGETFSLLGLLRIYKEAVIEAVGDLPRFLAVPE